MSWLAMRLKYSCKKLILLFSCLYILGMFFAAYIFYHENNISAIEKDIDYPRNLESKNFGKLSANENTNFHEVEIWGKASISLYLWQHILSGELTDTKAVMMQVGRKTINSLSLTFRTGPGLVPLTAPRNVSNLILVLNGRSEDKVKQAKIWLDSLPAFEHLSQVVLVMLGNEHCDNDWLLPYMHSKGGMILACFITYDCPIIDNNEFFQWPLGVAVYRGFPDVDPEKLDVSSSRPYLCNFLGTVYKNSSREKLSQVIKSSGKLQDNCLVIGRQKWTPLETNLSLQKYIDSLLKSDLTLSPVGVNTECYRIYEALSMGSVPVVEDIMTPGKCDATSALSPLRLLKSHGAPLLYLREWSSLPSLIKQESLLTYQDKVLRRTAIVQWYKYFKTTMSDLLIHTIKLKFFSDSLS